MNDLYDAEVAHNDAGFGSFLDNLKASELYENAVILFVSDHGEAFGEHTSWTHGIDLYSEVLHIPLVLRLPGGRLAGHRIDTVVQHIDILPTVLRLIGAEGTTPGRGHDLLDNSVGGRTAASYLEYWGRHGASVVTKDWKYIEPLAEGFLPAPELFDRIDDPRELDDLAVSRPVVAGYLASTLRPALKARTESVQTQIDEATRKELEALGYLQ